jgi:hypothetical protein
MGPIVAVTDRARRLLKRALDTHESARVASELGQRDAAWIARAAAEFDLAAAGLEMRRATAQATDPTAQHYRHLRALGEEAAERAATAARSTT